jgi:hypothetical protein
MERDLAITQASGSIGVSRKKGPRPIVNWPSILIVIGADKWSPWAVSMGWLFLSSQTRFKLPAPGPEPSTKGISVFPSTAQFTN